LPPVAIPRIDPASIDAVRPEDEVTALTSFSASHDTVLSSPWSRRRGLIAGSVLAVGSALALASMPWFHEDTWTELAIDMLAWSTFLSGVALRLWATLYVGGRKQESLVTEGPYSITRNPLYAGSFLMALSLGIFLQSLVFIGALIIVAWVHMALTVRAEEKVLRRIHGEAFDAYVRSTPRFLPDLRGFHSPPFIDVNVDGLRREMSRLVRWFMLAICMDLVAHFRDAPWWPHPLNLP